ncbi:hypothetical protein BJV77DRAFT_1010768, partial [Russula vinacea]
MFVYVVEKDTSACTASTCLVLRQRASAVQACRTTNQKNISGHTQQSNAMWPEAWITTLVSMLAMGGVSETTFRRIYPAHKRCFRYPCFKTCHSAINAKHSRTDSTEMSREML